MADKTTITVSCTKEEKDEIAKRKELRGFKSDNDYVRHLLVLGTLTEQAITGRPLNRDTFAAAFFTMVDKVLDVGAQAILEAEASEGLVEWRTLGPETKQVITGQISRKIK